MKKITKGAGGGKVSLSSLQKALKSTRSTQRGLRQKASSVRKNMYIRQDSLDDARAALGTKTETETVDLALGLAKEMAAFRKAMLTGFDALMASGLRMQHIDEDLDFSGFAKRVPAAKA